MGLCWLGGRKGIWPLKTEWWDVGVVICLGWGADLHMAQLMPLPLIVSCFSKIQRAVKWSVCMRVRVHVCVWCRKWDAGFVDALMPQLTPQLHSNVVHSRDASLKVAAVRGFLSRFHLKVYHHLSCVLVRFTCMLLTHSISCVCWCVAFCIINSYI